MTDHRQFQVIFQQSKKKNENQVKLKEINTLFLRTKIIHSMCEIIIIEKTNSGFHSTGKIRMDI